MTAQDRVRVVERWIQVAQECEILKNFSSPCTVISALQKTSTSHLKNTRGKFPGGESPENLQELNSQDKPLSRELMIKEGPFTFAPPESNPQRVQEKQQQQQGVFPYLGNLLSDLLMLHLAMGDYLEVGEPED
ncbi:ral guanine nucleotide dissociation stimulator-like [Diceros bicornis minor]|nr:ral guanine nucleotide dissociation stimulator-like [Diceros bicornis minor]